MELNEVLNFISIYAIKIIGSIAIFVIGKWVAKKLASLANKMLKKANLDDIIVKFLTNVIDGVLLLFVVLAALSNLGIETTSFIAILGAAGLAVAMAFKDTFSNLGAGVLIVFFRPFKIGDFVEIAGVSGSIEEVNLFSTFLITPDNKQVIVPNSHAIGGNIINYSTKPLRRVDLTFGVGYEDDLKKAKEILVELANSNEKVLKDPAPFIAVSELADSSVNFVVRLWVKSPDYWSVYFEMIEKVKFTFDENNITIPYPQMEVSNKATK